MKPLVVHHHQHLNLHQHLIIDNIQQKEIEEGQYKMQHQIEVEVLEHKEAQQKEEVEEEHKI